MSEPFVAKAQVQDIILNQIRRSIPELGSRPISPDATIEQLGGHSLQVAEIVNGSMRELRIDVPARELASVRTTSQLVDVFMRHLGR